MKNQTPSDSRTLSTSRLASLQLVLTAAIFSLTVLCTSPVSGQGQTSLERLLHRLDTGRDGDLDPNEMIGNTREWVRRLGFDPNTYHRIDLLVEAYRNKGRVGGSTGPFLQKVPGLGNENDGDNVNTPGFTPDPDGKNKEYSTEELTELLGEEGMQKVYQVMRRVDSDEDGVLSTVEINNAKWGKPLPSESDLNDDGQLSLSEVGLRIQALEGARTAGAHVHHKTTTSEELQAESQQVEQQQRQQQVTTSEAGGRRQPGGRRGRGGPQGGGGGVDQELVTKISNFAQTKFADADENGDGVLKGSETSSMSDVPDADNNGELSREEVLKHYLVKNGVGETAPAPSGESVSRRRRTSSAQGSRRRLTFDGLDTDQDGQIRMFEFSNGAQWDGDLYEEWSAQDVNGDGMIAREEWTGR